MKKLIAMLLALVLVMGLVACGNTDTTPTTTEGTEATTEGTEGTTGAVEDTTAAAPVEANEATTIYTNIWNNFAEDKRFFAMGGDMNNMVDNAPGNYALDDEGVATVLYIPETQIGNVACISSLMNGMMANHYTGSVCKLNEGADAAAFADAMHDAIGSAQWICGMPEKMLIVVIDGEYVLSAFGLNDNIDALEAALEIAYPDAEVKYSEAIEG